MRGQHPPSGRQTVAVVGAGNVGALVGGLLAAAGQHAVTACVRRPLLPFVLTGQGEPQCLEVPYTLSVEEAVPVDWVLLATKAQQTLGAAAWLAQLCGPGTCLVVLQNGVDHADRVRPFSGAATVLPGLMYANVERAADGALHYRASVMDESDLCVPAGETGQRFADLLAHTPLRVRQESDFVSAAWRKLLGNLAANPLTAITGRRLELFRDPDLQSLALALLREGVAVGRACGAHISEQDAAGALRWLLAFPPDTGTSMLADRTARRGMEQEALTGAVVRLGLEHGISTPVNSLLLTLLNAIDGAP